MRAYGTAQYYDYELMSVRKGAAAPDTLLFASVLCVKGLGAASSRAGPCMRPPLPRPHATQEAVAYLKANADRFDAAGLAKVRPPTLPCCSALACPLPRVHHRWCLRPNWRIIRRPQSCALPRCCGRLVAAASRTMR
jgi:hypothetical protein